MPLSQGMDGRMSEKPQYICVFIPDKECPVKTQYKLQPENLLGYCTICYINPTNKQETRQETVKMDPMMIVAQNLPMLLDKYLKLSKQEKDQLLDAIKLLADIQQMQIQRTQ